MSFTLTVLTCEAGRTSGYLLHHRGRNILIDCGPGVTEILQRHIPLADLDAVVLTHSHADHCVDIVGLAYALRFPNPNDTPLPLFVAPGMTAILTNLDDLFGVTSLEAMRRPIHQSFAVQELDVADAHGLNLLGDLHLTAAAALHAVPSAALRFTDGRTSVAFSSDTGPTTTIPQLADRTDLFVCEATYLQAGDHELFFHGHLTAELAGRTADDAHAQHLVLTHLAAAENAPAASSAAAGSYTGQVSVAARGAIFTT